MRFRRPSLWTMLGITKAKKQFNRTTGLTAIRRPFRAPGNARRRVLRHAGYYRPFMKWMRLFGRLSR